MARITGKLQYDNCKSCANLNCEHAGENREFVVMGGKSCKVPFDTHASEIRAAPNDSSMANLLRELLLSIGGVGHEIPTHEKILDWLRSPAN